MPRTVRSPDHARGIQTLFPFSEPAVYTLTEEPEIDSAAARATIRARGSSSCALSNSEENAVSSIFNQDLSAVIAATRSPQLGCELRARGGRLRPTCKIATVLLILARTLADRIGPRKYPLCLPGTSFKGATGGNRCAHAGPGEDRQTARQTEPWTVA